MSEQDNQMANTHGKLLAPSPPDIWSKWRTVSTVLAATLVPLAIALVGNWYTNSIKEKDRAAQFVTLAVAIISDEPTENDQKIREWAIRVIDHYSDVKFTDPEKRFIEANPIRSEFSGYKIKMFRGILEADVQNLVYTQQTHPLYISHAIQPDGEGRVTIIATFRRK